MPFAATWMRLESLILSDVSQKEKDKYRETKTKTGSLGLVDANYSCRTDKQWDPTVQHRELYPISSDRTWWKTVWEKKLCVCVYIYIYTYTYIHTHTHTYIFDWVTHVQQKFKQCCKSTIEKEKFFKKGFGTWILVHLSISSLTLDKWSPSSSQFLHMWKWGK